MPDSLFRQIAYRQGRPSKYLGGFVVCLPREQPTNERDRCEQDLKAIPVEGMPGRQPRRQSSMWAPSLAQRICGEHRSVLSAKNKTNGTYIPMRSSELRRAERLLITNEDDLKRPPRRLANVLRLSRTILIAPLHPSWSTRAVGSTSLGSSTSLTNLNNFSKGFVGIKRMTAPQGIDTKPSARDMPHSRPPIRVTWKAAPPTNTIRT